MVYVSCALCVVCRCSVYVCCVCDVLLCLQSLCVCGVSV